jgi:lipopolysaccharide transport system ATP-binding protein
MSSDWAICAENLAKCYALFDRPADRLKQMLWRARRKYYREFWALRDVNLKIRPGEVLGIIGRNGAGKSTLLQLICGTLTPTSGKVAVNGRVAALLELGAGFNPEFSGRENVYFAAAVLGLRSAEIDARFDMIVDFSGVRDFIDQPVKTYSSGMYVRLAFSIATSVDPDILVIDEALSVGDGQFARKSFDRIISLKEAGKTILFCSHALYQIEALCGRALWLEQGQALALDTPASVVSAYQTFLGREAENTPTAAVTPAPTFAPAGAARIAGIEVLADNRGGKTLAVTSRHSTVSIRTRFVSDPTLPAPSVAVGILAANGQAVATAGTHNDGITLSRQADGSGEVRIDFPAFPLLKGTYMVSIWLMCEAGLHMYDTAEFVATLHVTQTDLEQGVVSLDHHWAQ